MRDWLIEDRERWSLWAPVLMAAGVLFYFALPIEPLPVFGALLILGALVALIILRRMPTLFVLSSACLCCCLGLGAAQFRAYHVAAPVLEREMGPIPLVGTIRSIEPRERGVRVILNHIAMGSEQRPWAGQARLTITGGTDARPGDRIRVLAMLAPPGAPSVPSGFDFARQAWFQGIGAVGYIVGNAAPVRLGRPESSLSTALSDRLAALRNDLTQRIRSAVGGEAGAVAAALMTGEAGAISQELLDAYRVSGLAHLLSISGLHMALVAGLVFFVVRGGLALFPTIALRYNIKKWTAGIALLATFAYMMIAGAPVPTQRAFVMTGLVLLGVMLDRNAISMRMVGWAALVILLLEPDALIGASFQMSFAAVVALIAAYEALTPRLTRWRIEHDGWTDKAFLYLFGVATTTLIAGTATSVYGLYHFQRIATWSLIANLGAVPVTGFWIMPWAVLAFLLTPFGLEAWALVPMGWGVDAVDWIARQVASWPAASIPVRAMPAWGIVLFTLGGLWLCLWRARWRFFRSSPDGGGDFIHTAHAFAGYSCGWRGKSYRGANGRRNVGLCARPRARLRAGNMVGAIRTVGARGNVAAMGAFGGSNAVMR